MARWARAAAAMRAAAAAELVRGWRIWQLTPWGAFGARARARGGFPTERMASSATARRRPGQAATSATASASSFASAASRRRRDGPAVPIVPSVRARPQPAADRDGVRREPRPHRHRHRGVQGAAVALQRDQGVGAAPRDRLGHARAAGGGVEADERASDVQAGRQVRRHRGLAAAVAHAPLREHEAARAREGADRMQRPPASPALEGAARRLAGDGAGDGDPGRRSGTAIRDGASSPSSPLPVTNARRVQARKPRSNPPGSTPRAHTPRAQHSPGSHSPGSISIIARWARVMRGDATRQLRMRPSRARFERP